MEFCAQLVRADLWKSIDIYHDKRMIMPDEKLEHGRSLMERHHYKEAYATYLPLAVSGNAEAQCNLGDLLSLGLSTFNSLEEATSSWKEITAEMITAQLHCDEQNLAEAISWYEKASAQGYARAKHNLLLVYRQRERSIEAAKECA